MLSIKLKKIEQRKIFLGQTFKTGRGSEEIKWRIVRYNKETKKYFRTKEVYCNSNVEINDDDVYEGNSYTHELIIMSIQNGQWKPISE